MEDNKKKIIVICVSCLLIALLFSCFKGCSKKEEKNKVVVVPQQNFTKNIEDEEIKETSPKKSYHSSGSSGGSSFSEEDFSGPPALLTEEEKAEMAKSYEKDIEKINQLKKEWIENKLKESDNSAKAIEQLKLRANTSFIKGMNAFEEKDYNTAILSFNEVLKDKSSTAVTKYFACSELMDLAMEKQDMDLYFIAARMRANLISKEDLDVIGVEKDEDAMERVDNLENILKAKKDKKYYDICVQLKIREAEESGFEITEEVKKEIIEDVEKDISYYSSLYKELIE